MPTLETRCTCGTVRIAARDVSPSLGNRIVCYCDSCQAFPIALGKADAVLDEYGGTEIYQLPPAHLAIIGGVESIRCLRLSEKGLHRFYAGCCDTPLANAPGPGLPFVGLLVFADTDPERRDERLGPIRAHLNVDGAKRSLPPERKGGLPRVLLRILSQMVIWRLRGVTRPHPFFRDDGRAIVEPEVRGA